MAGSNFEALRKQDLFPSVEHYKKIIEVLKLKDHDPTSLVSSRIRAAGGKSIC